MTKTDKIRAALDKLVQYAQDSNGCQYGTLCASLVQDIAQEALSELDGCVVVPVEPTSKMVLAGYKEVSDINEDVAPIYRAMISPYVKGEKE